MKKKLIILSFFLVLLQGCATSKYYVNVDSISTTEVQEKTEYILLSDNEKININDLQFKEYASYIDKALKLLGYEKATMPTDADVAIFLGYSISEPKQHQYSYSIPTYGQTGVSSSNTYGTVNTYGNNANYASTTTYTPTYGITGSTSHIGTSTTYTRTMQLTAFDVSNYSEDKDMTNLWKTSVISSGSSNDLRFIFPVLVAAAMPYIGTNTGRKIEVSLSESDKNVLEIRGIEK
jgi:hypothetical protein